MQVWTIQGERDWRVHAGNDEEYERIHDVLTSAVFRDVVDSHADLTDLRQREAVRHALALDALPADLWIEVDYGKSLAEMVTAGAFDLAVRIDAKTFKIEKGNGGIRSFRCELFQRPLRNFTPSNAVVHQMKERGLRPAKLEELLSFGATYPSAQRRYRIIALGSVSNHPLLPHVPLLESNDYLGGNKRVLSLENLDGDSSREIGWRHTNTFLGIYEEGAESRA